MKKILLFLLITVNAITISAQTNSCVEAINTSSEIQMSNYVYDIIDVCDTVYVYVYDTVYVYDKYHWNEEHSMLEKVYYGDLKMADGEQDYCNYYIPTIDMGIVERIISCFRVTI